MPRISTPVRRVALFVGLAFVVITVIFTYTSGSDVFGRHLRTNKGNKPNLALNEATLKGAAIASKLGNETAKAELGHASWKLFHTTFARFPDKPSPEESLALETYIHLFARLYPCGECATHFQAILQRFPPQTSSRSNAAAWGCHVHNEVNKSLKKDIFDCSKIGDFYHCGCADEVAADGRAGEG